MTRATLAALLLASPANAFCTDHDLMMEFLADKYGEHTRALGITTNGAGVMTLLINPDTNSWTIIATDHDHNACMVGAGTDFTAIEILTGDPA